MYSNFVKSLCDPRNVNRTLNIFRSVQLSKYSTVPQSKDPFGIEGEQGLEDIVQGIYVNPPVPRKSKDQNASGSPEQSADATGRIEQDETESTRDAAQTDPDAKYLHWRRNKAQRALEEDITAEQVYSSHFGEIRFDRENRVKHHGQFDEEFFNADEAYTTVSEKSFSRLARKSSAIRNTERAEPINDVGPASEITGKSGKHRVQQSPDIDKLVKVAGSMKSAMKQIVQEKITSENESPVLEEPIQAMKKKKERAEPTASELPKPKTAYEYLKLKRMTEAQKNDEVVYKLGGKEFHVGSKSEMTQEPPKHVPAVYQKPDYNKYTKGEMFSLLKKHICFHNEFLVALNKPFGLPMHTGTTECRHTVIDFLEDFAKLCGVPEIFPCHRLDKDTTGVLLLAKSQDAATAIKMKFANRTILKQYFAIVKGCPAILEGTIKIPIGEGKVPKTDVFRAVLKPDLTKYNITSMQKNCKEAITKYKVLRSHEHCAFLEVFPETGLTHQIRVHLAHGLGTPIIGDHKYSHRDKMAPQRLHEEVLQRLKVKQSKVRLLPLHLHCSKLEFTMPDGFMSKNWHEPVFVHARPPNFFLHTLRVLALKNR